MLFCKLSSTNRQQNDTGNNRQDCRRKVPITIGTWNVRSLSQTGKLDNVLLEMNRLNVDIMGIAETFYDGVNEFEASLITTNDKFRIIYSGSEKNEEALHL